MKEGVQVLRRLREWPRCSSKGECQGQSTLGVKVGYGVSCKLKLLSQDLGLE